MLSLSYFRKQIGLSSRKNHLIEASYPLFLQTLNKLQRYPKKRRFVPFEIKLYKIISLIDLLPCSLNYIVVFSLFSFGNFSFRCFSIVGVLMVESTYPFLLESNTWRMWLFENLLFIPKKIFNAIWLCYEWSYAIIGYSNQLVILFISRKFL